MATTSPNIDIKYLNRDFNSFKQALINFAQAYFPNTNNDFSDASPATMIIEQASVIGDILSLYTDRSVQENFLEFAVQKDNIMSLAYTQGYRPRVTSTAVVILDVYQQIPALVSGGTTSPDYSYAVNIATNAKINSKSNSNVTFITQAPVNFAHSSSSDPTTVSVYSVNSNTSQPEYYLLKKQVQAIAGTINTQTYSFGNPVKFDSVTLPDTDIIEILSVVDSDGNTWYEVPYLAQSTIYDTVPNIPLNDPTMAQDNGTVPYILKLRTVQRRFATRYNGDSTLTMYFGAGVVSQPDETIIPNTENVGMGLIDSISMLNTAFDPANPLYTKQYGLAPSNTTLNITYINGGGVTTNVPANDITTVYSITKTAANSNPNSINQALFQQISNSVTFTNENAASGGGAGDSVDDIRLHAMAAYPTQLRCVTNDDIVTRAVSLPSQYGAVAKAYATSDYALATDNTFVNSNPLGISLYILSYDANQNLTTASNALKENLKNYLSQYAMLGDGVSIKDAFVINIQIGFSISILPSYNSQQILSQCLNNIADYYGDYNTAINQPIILADIYTLILKVKGVQSVLDVNVNNVSGVNDGYSQYGYDIVGATKNGIIYPSRDPSIFEIKYPSIDIKGRIVTK
jgi:hypothetical protein